MLWRRLDVPGHDACRLEKGRFGWRIAGAAVFRHAAGPANIAYAVALDRSWRTLAGRVHGVIGERRIDCRITRDEAGWRLNGAAAPGLAHLVDLDFSFTPATNFTQLRRLPTPRNEAVRAPVAWFDLDAEALTELSQIYQRRGEAEVRYEAPTLGFETTLELAANGFIRRYPPFWEADEG